VVRQQPILSAALFDFVVARLAQRDEPILSLSAAEVLRQAHLTDTQVLRVLRVVRESRLVPFGMLLPAWREVTSEAASQETLEFLSDSVREGIQLRQSDLERALQKLLARRRPSGGTAKLVT
jgi:hypothetical protein